MPNIHTIDLHFQNKAKAIACYAVESNDGLVLIESGPETTYNSLKSGIENIGFKIEDITHVLLTHIHFDHAGAAWKLAENGAKIYVHPVGLPHLASPEKLWNSAAQIYGDQMELLWGSMQPIAQEQLVAVGDKVTLKLGELIFTTHYTPGHAVHHNAYQLEDVIFTGDVAGVKVGNGPVVPPCPPPDIHIEHWKNSIEKMRNAKPSALYLTHFGIQQDVSKHLDELEAILDDWAQWMKSHFENQSSPETVTPKFMEYTENQLREKGLKTDEISVYEYANPSWMSVAGLLRYWKLKAQGRIS